MIITKSPFAEMFARLFELKDADPNPTHPDTYLQHLAEGWKTNTYGTSTEK